MKNGLYLIRKSKKMTLEDVAKKMGCSISAISYYESGMRTPTIDDITKLALAYKTTPKKIIDAWGVQVER